MYWYNINQAVNLLTKVLNEFEQKIEIFSEF